MTGLLARLLISRLFLGDAMRLTRQADYLTLKIPVSVRRIRKVGQGCGEHASLLPSGFGCAGCSLQSLPSDLYGLRKHTWFSRLLVERPQGKHQVVVRGGR